MDNLNNKNGTLSYGIVDGGKFVSLGVIDPPIEIDDDLMVTDMSVLNFQPESISITFKWGYQYKPSKCKGKRWNSIQKERAMLQIHWLYKKLGVIE